MAWRPPARPVLPLLIWRAQVGGTALPLAPDGQRCAGSWQDRETAPDHVWDCLGARPRGRYLCRVDNLAPSAAVDVGALSALFRSTTASYKYVFFLGLLRCLDRHHEPEPRMPLGEVIVELLALAWYPHTFFRLSFGVWDRIGAVLDELSTDIGRHPMSFSSADVERLRAALRAALTPAHHRKLVRYVPHLLLAPFFQAELAGVSQQQRMRAIATLARQQFTTRKPLYCIEGETLILHPDWAAYLRENRRVVEGWVAWHWLAHVQGQNPSVPNVAGKLFPVLARSPLTKQIAYWDAVAQAGPLRCFYSQAPLARVESLDHYVPWSFVLHDRIWNLVPATRSANSAKGDRLASPAYLDLLVEIQCHGLITSRAHLARRTWERFAEEFEQDLRVPGELVRGDPPDRPALREALARAYRDVIPALESLAARQGFSPGWALAPA